MKQVLLQYGTALLFVGAALLVSLLFQPYLPGAFLVLFVAAVMLAGWFGRTGPGLFAVVISVIVVGYYFIAPHGAFRMDVEEILYFLSFLLCSVVASWLSSARRLAEEKQKAHLDELFEQAPEAIMLVDLKDRVLRVNKEFSRIFQYRPDEVVTGLSTAFIVPQELRQQAIVSRERLVRGEHVSLETIRRRKDGSLLNVSEMAFPVIVAGQQIAHYVIIRDITETRQASEALQRAQAELARCRCYQRKRRCALAGSAASQFGRSPRIAVIDDSRCESCRCSDRKNTIAGDEDCGPDGPAERQ
jgi:PAS domain S-box-containing protein